MTFTFNSDSLRHSKVSEEECLEVVSDPFKTYYDNTLSRRNNTRRMWIGQTLADHRLEIVVEYMRNNIDHVYHASKAQKESIRRAI